MSNGDRLEFTWEPSAAVLPPMLQTTPGATNYSVKVISQNVDRSNQKIITLTVEGKTGESYRLNLFRSNSIASVQGAVLEGDHLNVTFDKKGKEIFEKKDITIELK